MADLRTTYLGLKLEHPIIAGASPMCDTLDGARRLEDGGAAAIVLRSLYEEQLRAESMATHASMAGPAEAFAEAISYFPDPEDFVLGPQEYLRHLTRVKEALGIPVIASLNGVIPGRWLDYATMMEQAGADAVELNLYEVVTNPRADSTSIERSNAALITAIRERTKLPIAVKLSPFYTSLPNVASRYLEAGATALVLFNRFFEPDLDIERIEVTPHLELSSARELLLRLRWLAILSGSLHGELAVSGGVQDEIGVVKSIMCGANAVQVVSEVLRHGPGRFAQLRAGLNEWLDEYEYVSVRQMHGCMNIKRCPDPNAHTRAQYLKMLHTWKPEMA